MDIVKDVGVYVVLHKYRKSYECECISRFMSSDGLKVLKITKNLGDLVSKETVCCVGGKVKH